MKKLVEDMQVIFWVMQILVLMRQKQGNILKKPLILRKKQKN